MEEDNQRNPLAPATKYLKSDEEFATNKPFNPSNYHHQKGSSKCLVYVLLAVVLQSILFLIIGLIVLRFNDPSLRLSSATVNDLHYESTSLNMTFVAGIRLNNMNFGRFTFHGGSTSFLYGNATIGTANIDAGRIGGRKKREINVTVKVVGSGEELSANYMNFSRDVDLGMVKVWSFAELKGQVRVMKIVNRHRTAFMNCSMDLNLTSQAIKDLYCQ